MRLILQIGVTVFGSIVIPVLAYTECERLHLDVSGIIYSILVAALSVSAILIWWEGFLAPRSDALPVNIPSAYPKATAIIVAYLPNEKDTITETIHAFLNIAYPGELEILLAYNSPEALPIEASIHALSRKAPQFIPFRVDRSMSKAENVNAAAQRATGEFVGIFDADHHPAADSFVRAWHWLSSGYDVVQGRCVIRNCLSSWVTKLITVEFETMYGLCHPGRARLHGFGLFGGSNGYWNTNVLRAFPMRQFMLTEDIDASLRVLQQGYRIACDPYLVSYELAPSTLAALWNQRSRWAQGWFQVSLRHLRPALCCRRLSTRQKLGVFHLLAFSAISPWLSLQILPLLLYWYYVRSQHVAWFIPVFVFTTLLTLSISPGQTVLTYRVTHPELKRRPLWFAGYIAASLLFYSELKNLISRVAHVKELMRERRWQVTPRSAPDRGWKPDRPLSAYCRERTPGL